jgi:hypothetical protein
MHLRHHLIVPAVLSALLAACANTGVPDDDIARLLVAPDKFVLYECPDIARKAKEIVARQRKLERLMAQASADSGGRMVSAVAYRPEYLVARGEMIDLRAAALEKKCNFDPALVNAAEGDDEAVAAAPDRADEEPATLFPPPPEIHPRAPGQ